MLICFQQNSKLNVPLKLSDYYYQLPVSRIAQEPLVQRDMAKLLVYQQGQITDFYFHQIPDLLPSDSFLVSTIPK
ncbi:MAG: S-adenosylmethionine:tRNA ribosyltransferase-isomerase [Hydrococcus sp. RM1_1_31]|nr:S-adenosylmethionine:tRNA ribosyltransferase-isomerase [Hydrococcus sp. RM1_1_31]